MATADAKHQYRAVQTAASLQTTRLANIPLFVPTIIRRLCPNFLHN